ncbi:hypothetical protein A5789_24915 [Nocardia sp. 852002-51101_SCH5132738]|uniref:hypothetical protein n=1 Tax=Nocardia sp. 852002-51101_SCH5132738 TaxID=1834095 RepID=UPI0007E9E261|nr:hypothetical protein [Nocardia sp. 852002-51101_SCH5132738]OBA53054.1 hypothetical protein A5789_24915 [Nocardia sp. 852002-51101_SCH5132738]
MSTAVASKKTTEWLVTLTGPVTNTYAALWLSDAEVATVLRLARELAGMATDSLHPALRLTPMDDASESQRRYLRHAERERLLAALAERIPDLPPEEVNR